MSNSGQPILPVALDMAGKSAKHTNNCEVESLTGPIGLGLVGCSV